jgi:gluconate 5-dehydrogenase
MRDLDDVMDVDFRGTFLVSRAVAKEMVKHQSGKIINIASLAGKIASSNMSGYCASKAAVVHLNSRDGPWSLCVTIFRLMFFAPDIF